MDTLVWVLVAIAIGITLVSLAKSTKSTWGRKLIITGLVLAVSGLGLSLADKAGAATASRPTENHTVQCVAGGLGVAGAWLGTLGSVPTTAGIVTAGATVASVGATIAWYDACPEFAHKVINFMNPGYVAFWSIRTIWGKAGSFFSDEHRIYQPTGRFCVARYGNSTKRCFLWKGLAKSQWRVVFRKWLVSYSIPARLYTGQLYITH